MTVDPPSSTAPELPLRTPRMLLRRFVPADLDALADLHGDPRVMRRIDDGRPASRETVERETLPALLREYREGPAGSLGCLVAEDAEGAGEGEFLGWFSLRPAHSTGLRPGDGLELGYRLRPAVWGRGYATEGARTLVDTAFTDLGAEWVVATTMTVNTASRRVLEKAGPVLVRTFFEEWPDPIEGAEHGDVEYALTREEWSGRLG